MRGMSYFPTSLLPHFPPLFLPNLPHPLLNISQQLLGFLQCRKMPPSLVNLTPHQVTRRSNPRNRNRNEFLREVTISQRFINVPIWMAVRDGRGAIGLEDCSLVSVLGLENGKVEGRQSREGEGAHDLRDGMTTGLNERI